jgi:DEAD/DEAH box helicase domain-containing protein
LVTAWRSLPALPAHTADLPPDLDPRLGALLRAEGVEQLYTHQAQAVARALAGEHVVVVTPTASGKTWCYNLPVLHALLANDQARALYLFPTKALAHDQLEALRHAVAQLGLSAAVEAYDGDTPPARRAAIRRQARVIITNPDMLHVGILPNVIGWHELLTNLRYVVIDEMHAYRGIFGSHVANVLRRLERLCRFYGSAPQFICCSATIANPQQLASRLIEQPASLVTQNGAPRGERQFVLLNPPLTDARLGLRRPALQQAQDLALHLLQADVQSVVFVRSRREVERLVLALRRTAKRLEMPSEAVRGYRGGYLPRERRAIEAGLRSGQARLVVATTALELGVDIGGLEACVMVGYPGTIASTWQQAGRVGRGLASSAVWLIAGDTPLDQYVINHPDYLLGQGHEQALINPDNLHLLLSHLPCALRELPLADGERYGRENTHEILEYLQELGIARHVGGQWLNVQSGHPAAEVSLRSADPHSVSVVCAGSAPPELIGQLERAQAPLWVHEGAIYMHEGQQYAVQTLDWDGGLATVEPVEVDYFTQASSSTRIQIERTAEETRRGQASLALGEVLQTTRWTRYRKLRLSNLELLGWGPIDLPEQQLLAAACWLVLDDALVERLRQEGWWTGEQVQDRGPNWPQQRNLARQRDGHRCRWCGAGEMAGARHHVHHVRPFREFAWRPGENTNYALANDLDNLITLCPTCHRRAEQQVAVQSTLAGAGRVLSQIIPLALMCDPHDLSVQSEMLSPETKRPTLYLIESIPGGVGLSDDVYAHFANHLQRAADLVGACPCANGCPSCIGADAAAGPRAKEQVLRLLSAL